MMRRPLAETLPRMTVPPHRFPPTAAAAAARFGAAPATAGAGFAAGTPIDTPDGPVAVERLRPGDRVSAVRGAALVLRRVVAVPPGTAAAIRVAAGAFGPGRPRQALLLGPRQAVWLDGQKLAAAALAVGGAVDAAAAVALHVLVADRSSVLLAAGLPCALRPPVRPERDPQAGAALARARLSLHGDPPARAAPPAAPVPLGAPPSGAVELAGAVELGADGVLTGWALDRDAPGVAVLLEALLDDVTIGFALADEARPDLAMAGLGGGRCGFTLKLALPPAAAARLLRLHVVGSGAALPGTPLLLFGGGPGQPGQWRAVVGGAVAAAEARTLADGLGLLPGTGRTTTTRNE